MDEVRIQVELASKNIDTGEIINEAKFRKIVKKTRGEFPLVRDSTKKSIMYEFEKALDSLFEKENI